MKIQKSDILPIAIVSLVAFFLAFYFTALLTGVLVCDQSNRCEGKPVCDFSLQRWKDS
jgi:hypothetical protein